MGMKPIDILLANKLRSLETCSPWKKILLPSSIPSTFLSKRAPLIRFSHSEMLRSTGCMGSSIQRTFSIQSPLAPRFIIIAET